MKSRILLIVAASALTMAACKRSDTRGTEASGAAEAAPRRNTAESLGFASEADYFSSSPTPAANPAPATSARGTAVAAPISRNLKSADGRSVEALLLSRTDTAVRIRRRADAAEFTIPLEKLSAADRKFIEGGAVPLEPGK